MLVFLKDEPKLSKHHGEIGDDIRDSEFDDDDVQIEYIDDLDDEKILSSDENNTFVGDVMSVYMKQALKSPLLKRQEEISLSLKIREGDRKSWEKMITSNLRLVVRMASRYKDNGVPMIDLISEGNIGLMTAVDKFDPDKGWRFSTYATWWIRQSIQRGLVDMQRTVRWPVHFSEMLRRYKKIEASYLQKGEIFTPELAQKELGFSDEQISGILSHSGGTISLDEYYSGDEDSGSSMIEKISSETSVLDESDVALDEKRIVLNDAIAIYLDDRSKQVLKLRYGIGCSPQTLEQVSDIIGVTRERIRQIELHALRTLKLRLFHRSNIDKDCVI